jgi:hypothetical protein
MEVSTTSAVHDIPLDRLQYSLLIILKRIDVLTVIPFPHLFLMTLAGFFDSLLTLPYFLHAPGTSHLPSPPCTACLHSFTDLLSYDLHPYRNY